MKLSSDTALVYIITHLELGGAQKVCLSLYEGLKKQGVPTYLIAGKQGALVHTLQPSDHLFFLDTLERNIGIRSLWREVKNFLKIRRILRDLKKQYKHIIVHTHCTKAGILGRWAAWSAGVKTRIHTIHGFAFHDHQPWIIWHLIYATEWLTSLITTHFICVASADVKTGIRLFPRFAKKHSIIRAAVAWDQFYLPAQKLSSFTQEPAHFIFGTVSCFKAQKNLFDLLRAFRLVHHNHPHARLEIIGDGILRPALQEWIAENNLQQSITLHGWQEHVAPLMMQWHAFVLSSLWEGLPCAIIEARLLKLPVLSYNTGGINEVITSGENGFLYPQKEWEQLACGMASLIEKPTLYSHLRSYPDNLHDFKDGVMHDQHHELYKSLHV